MGVFPVAMSLTVTFMSAMTLLGNPAEIYNYNTMWWWLWIAHLIAIVISAYIFIPFFFKLQVTSVFEVTFTVDCVCYSTMTPPVVKKLPLTEKYVDFMEEFCSKEKADSHNTHRRL
jgi:hypothetical protein